MPVTEPAIATLLCMMICPRAGISTVHLPMLASGRSHQKPNERKLYHPKKKPSNCLMFFHLPKPRYVFQPTRSSMRTVYLPRISPPCLLRTRKSPPLLYSCHSPPTYHIMHIDHKGVCTIHRSACSPFRRLSRTQFCSSGSLLMS